MLEFIKHQPRIMEKFVAHLETPAVVDLLYRVIQCEESVPNAEVVDWLSNQDLITHVVDLLSPLHSTDLHNTVSELLKAIIALSAPSPASLTQNQNGAESFGFGGASEGPGGMSNSSVCGVNNRLVRELASEPIVRKMVGFMLDDSLSSTATRQIAESSTKGATASDKTSLDKLESLSEVPLDNGSASSHDSAVDDDDLDEDSVPERIKDSAALSSSTNDIPDHRDSVVTIRPPSSPPIRAPQVEVTPESCTSSLVTCIGVLIELIRKNNSDYFEQHLFHTLRTHLLQRQQEIAEAKAKEQKENAIEDDDDEMEGMEEAMAELADKLGIVHLGPMLQILCERLPDFQRLIITPRSKDDTIPTSLGRVAALTFERYRITELYAELLHCSNMALLNRAKGEGPQYSPDGVLQGGIEGLQILARTLQGGDASEDGDGAANESSNHAEVTLTESLAGGVTAPEADKREDEAIEAAKPTVTTISESKDATTTTKHTRDASSLGAGRSNGSEDTDDEALLSEVSLGDTVAPSAEKPASEGKDAATDEPVAVKDAEAREGNGIEAPLSSLSIGEAPSTALSGPSSPPDESTEYVVGDLLKKRFLDSNVIGTILTLFFEYPWNNFLHNVVYDILQQFFNGRMDAGLNCKLTMAVFQKGELTEKIVNGHHRNEESLKSARKIRMGYMGHMNLIADETVKLLERYPQEIEQHVKEHISPEWLVYVNETLKENREKESAPLAGGRPQALSHGMSFGNQQAGEGPSEQANINDAFASYLTSQMATGNTSDDDDSDEDASWLSQDIKQKGADAAGRRGHSDGFEDAFEPLSSSRDAKTGGEDEEYEDDDEWGPFADSSDVKESASHASSSAQAYLTPADWSSDFHRSTVAAERSGLPLPGAGIDEDDDEEDDENGSTNGENGDGRRKSSDSEGSNSSTPFVDLLDSASLRSSNVVAAAHARRPSLEQHEKVTSPTADASSSTRPRASSTGSSDPSAANASVAEEPLGPGVSADAHSNEETGMIERVIDGKHVQAPLDDVALMSSQVQSPTTQQDNAIDEKE
jgi:SIT4-associating protein SAP185/190